MKSTSSYQNYFDAPLTDTAAALKALELMGRQQYWLKIGSNKFFSLDLEHGHWILYPCTGHKLDGADGKTTWLKDDRTRLIDGVAAFLELSKLEHNKEGAFFIPAATSAAQPHKEEIKATDIISVEIDDADYETQIERYAAFTANSGLNFSMLVHSGSKSVHGHILLDRAYPAEDMERLRRLFVLALLGDPAVTNVHQPMRFPGGWRGLKRKYQSLLFTDSTRYSFSEFECGLAIFFDAQGWQFPSELPDEMWGDLRRTVKLADIPEAEKRAELGRLFEKGADGYAAERAAKELARAKASEVRAAQIEFTGPTDSLFDAVKRLDESLSPLQAFNAPGHAWGRESGGKARGVCQFHDSKSNSAYYRTGTGTATYHCPTCTNDKPWSPFAYFNKLQGRLPYPKGAEWATAAKDYLKAHGQEWQDQPKQKFVPKALRAEGLTESGKAKLGQQERAHKRLLTASVGFERDYGYIPNYELKIQIFEEMRRKRLIVWGSQMSTGKTNFIKEYLQWLQNRCEQDVPVYSVSHRNSLGESLGSSLGLPTKEEQDRYNRALGGQFTADSLHPRSGTPFNGSAVMNYSVLLADEIDQLLEHIVMGGTAIAKVRATVVEHFALAAANCGQVICMSAGAADSQVSLLQSVSGITEEQTLRLVNTHIKPMGTYERMESALHVWAEVAWHLEKGDRGVLKLSGQDIISMFGTQNAKHYFPRHKAGLRILVADSVTLKDPSNPQTFIECKELRTDGQGGTYELKHTVKLLCYINPEDGELKISRQNQVFDDVDLFIFTNALSTGISVEYKGFQFFGQIENGAGSIDDVVQSAGRIRDTKIRRFGYITLTTQAPYGNGSHTALGLLSGEKLNEEMQRLSQVESAALPENPLDLGGNIGSKFANYSLLLMAKRNREAMEYAELAFGLLESQGYVVKDTRASEYDFKRDGIISIGSEPVFDQMSHCEQLQLKADVRESRDEVKAADQLRRTNKAVDPADLPKLEKLQLITQDQIEQRAKLRVCNTFAIDPEAVTEELVRAEDNHLSTKLRRRYRLEQGHKAAGAIDAAKQAKVAKRGKTFMSDHLKRSDGAMVLLLEQLKIPALISHLLEGNEVSQDTTEVVTLIKQMIKRRNEVKAILGCTVGQVSGDKVVLQRPFKTIKVILEKLGYDARSSGTRTTLKNGQRGYKYKLHDSNILLNPDGTTTALVDYEKFCIRQAEIDAGIVSDNPPVRANDLPISTPESPSDSENSPAWLLDRFLEPKNAESVETRPLQRMSTWLLDPLYKEYIESNNQSVAVLERPDGQVVTGTPAHGLVKGPTLKNLELPPLPPAPLSAGEEDLIACIEYAESANHYREAKAELEQLGDFATRYWPRVSSTAQQRIRAMCAHREPIAV